MLDFYNAQAADAEVFDFDCDMDDAADIELDRLREEMRNLRVLRMLEGQIALVE